MATDKCRVKGRAGLCKKPAWPPRFLKESSLLEKGEMKTRLSHCQHQAPFYLCVQTPLKKILQVCREPELQMHRGLAVRSQCGSALNSLASGLWSQPLSKSDRSLLKQESLLTPADPRSQTSITSHERLLRPRPCPRTWGSHAVLRNIHTGRQVCIPSRDSN